MIWKDLHLQLMDSLTLDTCLWIAACDVQSDTAIAQDDQTHQKCKLTLHAGVHMHHCICHKHTC